MTSRSTFLAILTLLCYKGKTAYLKKFARALSFHRGKTSFSFKPTAGETENKRTLYFICHTYFSKHKNKILEIG